MWRLALLLLAGGAVSACDLIYPVEPVLTPRVRPADLATGGNGAASEQSAALRAFYRQVLMDGQTRGLLRTDGGGPDTPYTADMLARNFEEIAFFNEFRRGDQPLRRWQGPVRIEARFGPNVGPADQARDTNAVISYANRLARITGHPISTGDARPNFHVFFVTEDGRDGAVEDIRRIAPEIDAATLRTIRTLDRSTYCLVVALTRGTAPAVYTRAVAVIRAEQPDLMRLSCIHEEIAQGLGLANDSPFARPSIFNDDDEFALLTSHDEHLLRILYDARLQPGMRIETARPIVRRIAEQVMGGGS